MHNQAVNRGGMYSASYRRCLLALLSILTVTNLHLEAATLPAVVDDIALQLPKPGDNTLHILSGTLLEVKRINSKAPDPARVDSWDFIDTFGVFQAPAISKFVVTVNGSPVTVQSVGFKRRPLYAPVNTRDLRIENCLYLQLASSVADGQTVVVTNPDGTLWPSTMIYNAVKDAVRFSPAIHVNQEGYVPAFPKKAMIGYYLGSFGEMNIPVSSGFTIVNQYTGATVYTGTLTTRLDSGYTYTPTPYQKVLEADFSSVTAPGEYILKVPDLGASLAFLIDEGIAMGFTRAYALGLYHQRCGLDNSLPYTRHTHGVCHVALAEVPIPQANYGFTWSTIASKNSDYASNPRHTAPQLKDEASQLYPFVHTGQINVSLGHHDAGDYSKYTINCAQLIHYLVFAADNFTGGAALDNLGIPESSDGKSDLLQEAKIEADFLAKMQDTDGGFYFLVYPKNREYEDNVLPDQGDSQVVWPKTTSVTAAATAALAEIASSPTFKAQFPAESASYLQKATAGWNFLINAINAHGKDGAYQKITHYGDEFMHDDELAWAAASLYAATGNATYQTKLFEWYPNPNDVTTYRWNWWRLFEGYGGAVRDYAFAVRSGRLLASQLDSAYLAKCNSEITSAANDALIRYQNTAYGTSFPGDNKSFRSAGWYFSTSQGFDCAVGYLLNPLSTYLNAVVGNMNYEGGCNPVNVTYVTGLGWKRQREIVSQYAENDRRVLPPSGITLGAIQAGFSYLYFYGSELGSLCYPADGANTAPYPFYDRWGDSFNTTTELVGPDLTRSLATATFLATQTSLKTQPWHYGSGTITVPAGPPVFSSVTSSLSVPGLDLSGANVVWEVRDQEPAFGLTSTFTPSTAGEYWIEAEAEWPDGRRVFAANTIAVTDPNGGTEYTVDANTIALYHFNGNYQDSTANALHLTPSGNVSLTSANLGWMRTQSGQVARFSNGGDKLSVSIPDSRIQPGPGASALTIEARIYPRAYKAYNVSNYPIVELYQDYDSEVSVLDGIYNSPVNPSVIGSSGATVVSATQWNNNVAKNVWHDLRITFDTAGLIICYIDGAQISSVTSPFNYGRINNWTLTLGNFDGDIDEVRISNVIRANPGPNVSITTSDASASESGPDPGAFIVSRSGSTANALTVNYTIAGTASNGVDYNTLPTSVIIPAGASYASIVVNPIDDVISEPNETVILTLSSSGSYTIGSGSATITITDNDGSAVTVAATDANASETASDPGVFTITRTGSTASAVTVNFIISGTASNGTDYTALGSSVTIPVGAASSTVAVSPVDDSVFEGSETVILTLSAGTGYSVGSPSSATVTIADNDLPTVTVSATDANASETPGDAGTFTVTRTGSAVAALTVNFTLSGTAVNGSDYTTIASSVTIAAGASSAALIVTPIDDTAVEGSETVILTLSVNANYSVGSPSSGTVTIADNDSAGSGSDEFTSDANTIALYHFNGNFLDSSPNGLTLTAAGTVVFNSANTTWMQTPSGSVARFSNGGDKLTVNIPDNLLMPGSGPSKPITIEARIFPRAYKAWNVSNYPVVGIEQDWDTKLGAIDGIYNSPANPSVVTCSDASVCTAAQWQPAVSMSHWHSLRLTYATNGLTSCYIDNALIGSTTVTPNYGRINAWLFTLGNFDGDIDEVRVSNIIRTGGTPPTAPSNLIAAASATTQIDLTWTDNSSNEAGFKVERSTDNINFTEVAALASNVTSWSNTGLAANTRSYYRIRAYTSGGDSSLSPSASATTWAIATTIVAKKTSNPMTIDGNFTEAGWNFNTTLAKTILGTPNNTTKVGVMWDTSYIYVGFQVTDSALRNDSVSNWDDDAVEIYIDANHNKATTYDSFDRQIVKGWNDSVLWEKNNYTTGILHAWLAVSGGYNVEVAIPWSNLGITAAADKTIGFDAANDDDDNNGARDSQKIWSGTANNWTDTSGFGDLYLSAAQVPAAPAAPSGLIASAVSTSQIDLSWTDNSGNEEGFKIERSTDNITFSQIASVGANGISYSNTALTANSKYYYRVLAYNAAGGNSSYSTVASASTFTTANTIAAKKASSAINVDGVLTESGWAINNNISKTIVGTPNNTSKFGVLWDNSYLYVGFQITDANLVKDSPSNWDDDGVEIYIDANHNKGTTYDSFDREFVRGWNDTVLWEKNNNTTGVLHAWSNISGGYSVEIAIPWSNLGITPSADMTIGFDAGNDDDDNTGARDSQLMWMGTNMNWSDTSAFGDLYISAKLSP
jgi:hypothetical protein